MGIVIFAVILLGVWLVRGLVREFGQLLIFNTIGLFYRQRAYEAIELSQKLDEQKAAILVRRHRHRFWGLKISGFALLVIYAYITAALVYLFIHIWWVWWLVLLGTTALYWITFVTNISIAYIVYLIEKQAQAMPKSWPLE